MLDTSALIRRGAAFNRGLVRACLVRQIRLVHAMDRGGLWVAFAALPKRELHTQVVLKHA